MVINITTPKYISLFQILLRTKKYYKLKGLPDVVEGYEKNYYIFLRKRHIQIEIANSKNETIEEIQKYLDCIFKDDYIGIQEKYADVIELKRARLIKLS